MIAHVIDNVPLCTLLRLSSYTDRMYVSAVATALSLEHAASFFCCLCCSVRSYLSTWKTCEISVIYLSNQIGEKRQKTFATETKQAKQANDDVITQVHRIQSQNVLYGMQMQLQCMQMQMRMQLQNPVLDTTTVQVPSTLEPIIWNNKTKYRYPLPLTQDSGLTLHSDLAPYSTLAVMHNMKQ